MSYVRIRLLPRIIVTLLFMLMFFPMVVKADTTIGLDAISANYNNLNDAVWLLIYKVDYAHIPATDYNGIVKYDANAFTYYGNDELNQYGEHLVYPCENCKVINNSEKGEIVLNFDDVEGVNEYDYFGDKGAAPRSLYIPLLEKDEFDSSKQYEFTYIPDNYGELRITVEFNENGEVEVIDRSPNNFTYSSVVSPPQYNSIENESTAIIDEEDGDSKDTKTEESNSINDKKIPAPDKKDNTMLYVGCAVLGIGLVSFIFVLIINKEKRKLYNITKKDV